MKAIIFKEMNINDDRRRLYRTDTFGSVSKDIQNAKPYLYELEGDIVGEVIINGKIAGSEGYEKLYVNPHLSTIKFYVNEIENGNMTEDVYETIKECKIGYIVIGDEDSYKDFEPSEENIFYTHLVTYDHLTKKTEVTDIYVSEKRNKFFRKLGI